MQQLGHQTGVPSLLPKRGEATTHLPLHRAIMRATARTLPSRIAT